MREKFLALVEEVKNTEIVGKLAALYDASDKEGFKAAWQKFSDENQELLAKIKAWSDEFRDSDENPIFEDWESLDNPMEITVCIFIIGDEDVSECEIFGDWEELVEAMKDQDNNFAQKVADLANGNMICYISIEDIFNDNSDEDEEPEDCDDSDSDEKADAEDCNDSDSGEDVADDEDN